MKSEQSSNRSTRHPDYDGVHLKLPNGEEYHVGYSRLSAFFKCPRSFQYTYIDKIRAPGGLAVRRGQAYHGSLEFMLQWKIDHDGDLLAKSRCDKLAIRNAKAENLPDNEIYKVIDAVRFYWNNLYQQHRPLSVEKDFKIVRGGVEITGRIDLLEEVIKKKQTMFDVTDHKFSYDVWADSRAKYGCQPIIYQWAALDVFEPELGIPYHGFQYNICRLFPHPVIQRIEIPRVSQAESDWWEDQIYEAAKIIRRRYFPAIPSDKNCGFCDHKELCQPTIYKIKKSLIGLPIYDDEEV
jgi:CRISPR/Cas system-associated exonuclease Cas4 (RecB family)